MTFNTAALTYDQDFTQQGIAGYLRGRVWEHLDQLFTPPMRVLELGCGTGEDALHLLKRGVEVIATDASAAMLEVAQQKVAEAQQGYHLATQQLDFNNPSTWQLEGQIDGVYSNFGALNCTDQWPALAAWLATKLPRGAKVGLGVMGRFCLWESLWHGLHGDWRIASRRWSGQHQATLADGSTFPVFYPAPAMLARAFAPFFEVRCWMGLGTFLPSSDIYPIVAARPRLQNTLTTLEYHLAHRRPFRSWADHYWMELERVAK